MNQQQSLSADALLQHEPFVRAVVRGLLSDEARVQDVVQETWLTALRQPPRVGGSLRAWLGRVAGNLARDSHRSTSRRRKREQAVARPEHVESIDTTHERLAAQREVVDVVLALKDPYKTVVLLRYYQGLGPAEIAGRLGRSPATVRSQLSRAHEILRSALDGKFDGGRSVWSGLLMRLLPEAAALGPIGKLCSSTTVKAAVAIVGVATVAIVVVAKTTGTRELSTSLLSSLGGPMSGAPPEPVGGGSALVAVALETTREPVQVEIAAFDPVQRGQLASRSVQELFEFAVQAQRAIERLLLTPDEQILSEHSDLLSMADTGITRILTGNGTGSSLDRPITQRGGGTYYSFARRDHSYNAEPDLSFRNGKFTSGFYGGQFGRLMEIGDVGLADLPDRPRPVPYWLTNEMGESWALLWQDITLEDVDPRWTSERLSKILRRSIVPSGTSSTFLLRVFSPGEHDHLVAFKPLALDEQGCTLAWRILKTWPVPGEWKGPHRRDERPDVPPGPSWMGETPLADLMEFLGAVRGQARSLLLEVPEDVRERYLAVVGESKTSFAEKSGFARILHRGRWDALVEIRGAGAYYSFLTRSNSYNEKPELSLENDRYSSGFAGSDQGFLLDLGEIPFEQLGSVMSGSAPSGLNERERKTWEFMWRVRATVQGSKSGGRRALSESDAARVAKLGLGRGVPAIIGHSYLLRSVLFGTHDHLVAFTVVGGNDYGHTLAWRILGTWPVERAAQGW